MSSLRDRVRPRDKIVTINAEDVQRLIPVEVDMLLCQTTAKDMRKLMIVRGDMLVGYCKGPRDADGDRVHPAAGIAGSKGGCYSMSEGTSEEDEDRSPEPECVVIPWILMNNTWERRTGDDAWPRGGGPAPWTEGGWRSLRT